MMSELAFFRLSKIDSLPKSVKIKEIRMNKKLNVLKIGFALAVAAMVTGCASVGGIANKYVNNDSVEGVFYGANLGVETANNACKLIQNKDYRCANADQYKAVSAASKIGYADGFTGMYAFAPKDMDIGKPCVSGSSNCTYLKVKVEKGRLGTVLEVASNPGDNKCRWSGMPRIGGTVCPAYNWDYSKESFIGIAR